MKTKLVRTLNLESPLPPLTAASGLVRVGDFLYVIGDDENHLGVFLHAKDAPGSVHPLFPGTLPEEKKERKRRKPDMEAITYLPSQRLLIAIPSGSKPNRNRGALVRVDPQGAIFGATTILDLEWLYQWLRKHFDPPNIESMALVRGNFYLVHRGNKKGHRNALVSIAVSDFLLGRTGSATVRPIADIDSIDDVPLTITDAAALDENRLVFTAVAENTESSYDDGPCLGAGIGVMDVNGQVESFRRLESTKKLEGVFAEKNGNKTRLLLVNDEDDRSRPSELLEAEL